MRYSYVDRLEFFNHGYSLKSLDREGEYGGSKTRNQTISSVLHETKYAENKGTGIPKIRKYLKNAHLDDPIFISNRENNSFSVTFYFHQLMDKKAINWLSQFNKLNISEDEMRMLVFAYKNATISNEEGRSITGLDTILVSRLLTELRKKGCLMQHSLGSKTYYTISPEYECKSSCISSDSSHELTTKSETQKNKTTGGLTTKSETPRNKTTGGLTTKSETQKNKTTGGLTTKSNLLNHNNATIVKKRYDLLDKLPEDLKYEILSLQQRLTPMKTEEMIYNVCRIQAFSSHEISIIFGKNRTWSKEPIKQLLLKKKLSRSIPDKPNSRYQTYYVDMLDEQTRR